jgi:predicted NUDIX family NTP pyrophosphohydrolase
VSNTFSLEWPKGSGVLQDYPEIDDARWFPEAEARMKLVKGQVPILDALIGHLGE